MKVFSFNPLSLEGAFEISPFSSNDTRGKFVKDYSSEIFIKRGINFDIKEIFYTSSKKNVIRAIHFQNISEQGKLVRCIKGSIYDVIVDLRKNSETFGKWLGFYLSEENEKELLIPKGFGHGYLVLEDAIVSYKCDEKFYPEFDDGIIWNDKTLNINWPIENDLDVILSDKDKNLQTFEKFKGKIHG